MKAVRPDSCRGTTTRAPPSLRPEIRPGAPWTRRVARRRATCKGRDTFSGSSPHALRANNAKNCRREISITTSDFASSLAGTPALHATHATQGTPQGRASESKEQDMNDMKEKAMGAVKAFLERKVFVIE